MYKILNNWLPLVKGKPLVNTLEAGNFATSGNLESIFQDLLPLIHVYVLFMFSLRWQPCYLWILLKHKNFVRTGNYLYFKIWYHLSICTFNACLALDDNNQRDLMVWEISDHLYKRSLAPHIVINLWLLFVCIGGPCINVTFCSYCHRMCHSDRASTKSKNF